MNWVYISLVAACLGSAGSVGLSVVLKLKACPLCFYQRMAVFVIFLLILSGLVLKLSESQLQLICLLSWPIHLIGLGVAAFHVSLTARGILECPQGFGNLGDAPMQSLAYFLLSAVPLLLAGYPATNELSLGTFATYGTLSAFGLILAWLCIFSSPPLPPKPTKAYEQPLDICRPPFVQTQ